MTGPGDRSDRTSALGWIKWLLTTDNGSVAYARDIIGSAATVLVIGALLFGVSGVWPPMVAIESGSMEPHIKTGDLVFVMEEERFANDHAIVYNGDSTGIVPYQRAKKIGYKTFGAPGDVIVYHPNGETGVTPIIHRARFWVNESENWYDKANPAYIGSADNCKELAYCPAPHAGFITKGDNKVTNDLYDQVSGISAPVKPSWIIGTAEFRIPYLGFIRLGASAMGSPGLSGNLLYSFTGILAIGGAIAASRE